MPEQPVTLSKLRIVSGGQSGADIAALDWAISHGVDHGGWCPKGRRSEDGPIEPHYQLNETPLARYLQRTEWDVRDSDATVVFTLDASLDGGSRRTAQFADKFCKPWLHFRPSVHPKFLAQFLVRHNVTTLNVAGKRESSAPGIYRFVFNTLERAIFFRSPPNAVERQVRKDLLTLEHCLLQRPKSTVVTIRCFGDERRRSV